MREIKTTLLTRNNSNIQIQKGKINNRLENVIRNFTFY